MLGVAALFLMPTLPIEHDLRLLIVESGSMEPAIMTGSLVGVYPKEAYIPSDVITFESRFGDVPTTHRIVEIREERGQTIYTTKGDANEEADPDVVPMRDVLGAVWFSVPYVGYVLDFARQPLGFIFLIVLPALTFIVGELEKIWAEVRRKKKKSGDTIVVSEEMGSLVIPERTVQQSMRETVRIERMMDIATPVRTRELERQEIRHMTPLRHDIMPIAGRRVGIAGMLIAIVTGSAVFGGVYYDVTRAYPHDRESSTENALSAALLDFDVHAEETHFTIEDGVFDDPDGTVITITPDEDSIPLRYDVSARVEDGSLLLCEQIIVESGDPLLYDDALSHMTGTDVSFSAPWKLSFMLENDNGLSNGDTCTIAIMFTAWYVDHEHEDGYVDEETVTLTFEYIQELIAPAFAAFSLPSSLSEEPETPESTLTEIQTEREATEAIGEDEERTGLEEETGEVDVIEKEIEEEEESVQKEEETSDEEVVSESEDDTPDTTEDAQEIPE